MQIDAVDVTFTLASLLAGPSLMDDSAQFYLATETMQFKLPAWFDKGRHVVVFCTPAALEPHRRALANPHVRHGFADRPAMLVLQRNVDGSSIYGGDAGGDSDVVDKLYHLLAELAPGCVVHRAQRTALSITSNNVPGKLADPPLATSNG